MAIATDVIAILDELRATDGSLRRARIIGRLWNLARALPAEERRELAEVLAERYAPKVAERLGSGGDVQSSELLAMVRAVGRVDADEISDIMDQLQTSDGRRELLVEIADSLRDDLAEVDVERMLDDPEARAAALAAASRELAQDMSVMDASADTAEVPQPATVQGIGDAADVRAPIESPSSEGGLAGAGTRVHPGPGMDETEVSDIGEPPQGPSEGARGAGPDPDPESEVTTDSAPDRASRSDDRDEAAPTMRSPVWDPDRTADDEDHGNGEALAQSEPHTSTDPVAEAVEGVTWDLADVDSTPRAESLRAIRSPIERLRTLRRSMTTVSAGAGVALVDAFPDGWQRRRAVDAVVGALEPGDVPGAVAVINTMASASNRRWIVRSLLAEWPLDVAAATHLAIASNVPLSVLRLARPD